MKRQTTIAVLGTLLGIGLVSPAAQAEDASARSAAPTTIVSDRIDLTSVATPEGGVEWGRAEGVVKARTEDVLAILHDYARYAGLFPYFEKSKVLSQRGEDAIVYLEAKVLHGAATLWGTVKISSKAAGTDKRVVEAKLMKGKGNISQLVARWEVTPVDSGTHSRVVFQLLVDPDLPVPDMAVSHEIKNGAGSAFRALRRRVAERAALVSRPSSTL